ncbi:hypothetical protein [Nocardia sp. NBC_00416]|uniref:hypothetical protein n=1 Tax=Nocardia sp. NBC_00416 TaxID=2975991 RepID=UPI002E1FCD14
MIRTPVPGTRGPIVFHLACGERLEIVYDTEELGECITDPCSFGWISHTTRPAALEHWLESPYHSVDFGADEVDGRALAKMMVNTLRDLGVGSPKDLSLTDRAQQVGDCDIEYYSLTLQENP